MNHNIRDPLTGVFSRSCFQARFPEEIDRARQYDEHLTMMIIDIDYFKSINDAFGHSRGDEVIRQFAGKIHKTIRRSDRMFRYGGDEFVLLLPNTSKTEARILAERLIDAVHSTPFLNDPPVTLTCSIGMSGFPDDAQTPAELFEQADQRLLDAKSHGRDRYVHESISSAPAIILTELDGKIIERDFEMEAFSRFLDLLADARRGVMVITGQPGSGKTQCLIEFMKQSAMLGYLCIECDPILHKSIHDIQQYLESLQSETSPPIIIAIDNIQSFDRSILMRIVQMTLNSRTPVAGLIATAPTGQAGRLDVHDFALHEFIELRYFSRDAAREFLQQLLHWEGPRSFFEWLYSETRGSPGFIMKTLDYLIRRGVLKRENEVVWSLDSGYRDLNISDRLGLTSTTPPNNLPTKLTPFIGRADEVDDVCRLLDENRLVTITGAGGIGKTRLAIKVGYEKVRQFEHGVFFVQLASVTSPEFIITAVSDAIGFTFSGFNDPKHQLIDLLREKDLLLIMDNFEHLIGAVGIITDLLEHCPDVKFLTTTRELINIQGESLYELNGLPVPDDDSIDPSSFSSIQLFVNSARRVDPTFSIEEDCSNCIGRICRMVEGMPLGIELAAAWISVLSCAEIEAELQKSLDFLDGSQSRTAPLHGSLRAIFDHSWRLISDFERTVFMRMSVFRGGFTREAAQEITETPPTAILSLKDKSLLYRSASGRYYILESLRQYGEGKLRVDPGDYAQIKRRHREYFGNWLSRMVSRHLPENTLEFCRDIAVELKNIREGWISAVTIGDERIISLYMDGLAAYYLGIGNYPEGAHLFETALGIGNDQTHTLPDTHAEHINSQLLLHLANFLFNLARYDESLTHYENALAIFERMHDNEGIANTLNGLGRIQRRKGNSDVAIGYHERSLAIFREQTNTIGEGETLYYLAGVISFQGNISKARMLYELSLDLLRRSGSRRQVATILVELAIATGKLGDIETERSYLQESLRIRNEIQDRHGIASSLDILGFVEHFLGNYSAARQALQESLQIRRDIGDRWGIASSQLNLAAVLKSSAEYISADRLLQDSLAIFNSIGYRRGEARALNKLSELAIIMGRPDKASVFSRNSLEICTAIHDSIGIVQSHISLGYALAAEHLFNDAELAFRDALTRSMSIDAVQIRLEALLGLAEILSNQGPEEAELSVTLLVKLAENPALNEESKAHARNLLEAVEPMFPSEIWPVLLETASSADINELIDRVMAGSPPLE